MLAPKIAGRPQLAERIEPTIDNPAGRAPVLLVCDHASNMVPAYLGSLGLDSATLQDHVAWDIGALALSRRLAIALDAPLVAATVSRLVVDPNRDHRAHDLIPLAPEGAPIPGNAGLSAETCAGRIRAYHDPFHEAIAAQLAARPHIQALVSVHSFTPALSGKARPWHVGILHGPDARMADAMIAVLSRDLQLIVGRNQPYAPEQGVFYTMDRHAGGRATVMIEVRNDLIRDEIGQARWAQCLAEAASAAMKALDCEQERIRASQGV
jgi:predicted N-formylglutamate amidohydrolase